MKMKKKITIFLSALFFIFFQSQSSFKKIVKISKKTKSIKNLQDLAFHFKSEQNKNKIFLLLGPPACGKGTLSKECVNHLDWKHISTGQLCRQEIDNKTDIGQRIKELTAEGKLIDDIIITDLLTKKLKDISYPVVLDGFPRTLGQAKNLHSITLKNKNIDVEIVRLTADKYLSLKYAINRSICSNNTCGKAYISIKNSPCIPKTSGICDICSSTLIKRDDDKKETIEKRLEDFYNQENLILNYYKEKNINIITVPIESTELNPLCKQFEAFEKILVSSIHYFSLNSYK